MQDNLIKGLVIRVTGGEVWVEVPGGDLVQCQLRGKLRLQKRGFHLVAGDRVTVKSPDAGGAPWTIEGLEDRECWLSRFIDRDKAERIMVANISRLYVVATLESPPLHYGFIDRVLVSAEFGHVESSIIMNKIDLYPGKDIEQFVSVYSSCGYPVLTTSALSGEGIDRLGDEIAGGVYAFVGESGVGKSSILMSIDPGLDLKIRTVGEKSGRGRHTTSFSQLYKFGSGFLADTPGVQTFGFPGADGAALPDCFPEFEEHSDICRFQPCSHSHEPGCGVKQALENGLIFDSRYRSYLNILSEVEERGKRSSW
jgi:ribosome biogenesis GTPase